jgi:integrase
MPRARTGTLALKMRDGALVWHARVTTDDGRPWYSLGTADRAVAKRRLKKLLGDLAAGATGERHAASDTPDTVREYAEAWLERRDEQGVAMVTSERGYVRLHVLPVLGALPLASVRPAQIRAVLDGVVAKGLAQQTVNHVRAVMNRIFDTAWRDEILDENPVLRVRAPRVAEIKKARATTTDEEFDALMGWPEGDLELKMLSLLARCEGGMRSGDLNAWAWEMVDLEGFTECTIPRSKTRRTRPPQRLDVPPMLRAHLRAWWERAGEPTAGPVFPVRRGTRAGEFKAKGSSYADKLRRELAKALTWAALPLRPELFTETDGTLPVDFHSFRRAFKTALAEAGVSTEKAMRLSGSTDPKVHASYVMNTASMRVVPEAALPKLTRGFVSSSGRNPSSDPRFLRAGHEIRTRDPQLGKRPNIDNSPGKTSILGSLEGVGDVEFFGGFEGSRGDASLSVLASMALAELWAGMPDEASC